MSVRKRSWITARGESRESWIVDYADQQGTRRLKTFKQKKQADAFAAKTHVEVREGVHVADSASVTVQEAAELWLARAKADGLEAATLMVYGQHVKYRIVPFIGLVKLSQMSVPRVRAFEDRLREEDQTPYLVRSTLRTLGSIIADAQERGLVAHNAVREMRSRRRRSSSGARQKGKLKIGIDIPSPDEIRTILNHATSRWRPLLLTAAFTGLRASELRGLRWADVDLDTGELHVRQRADRFNDIGRPKSASGERTVPFGKIVKNTLKEWRLACPKGELDLVFPSATGKVDNLSNIVQRGLGPAEIGAGVTTADGKAKYPGFHALRHFYASWCINRVEDGGLGLSPKEAQERLGHASIVMTLDRYGHLFPRGNNADLDKAEAALLA
jgi:integrase